MIHITDILDSKIKPKIPLNTEMNNFKIISFTLVATGLEGRIIQTSQVENDQFLPTLQK